MSIASTAQPPARPSPAQPSPITLLPLDERPVNTGLPADVARIAGVRLLLPPRAILPRFRTPGDTGALAQWLDQAVRHGAGDADGTGGEADAGGAGDAIVSLDMLAYGGLIGSRTSADGVDEALARLGLLEQLNGSLPGLRLDAVGLVMRASDSYSPVEEPEYWRSYGRELHRLGGDAHRMVRDTAIPDLTELTSVPTAIVSDFERRRLRNHIVNLRALDLHERGVFTTLAITADDTATWSAGSAEQEWLRHWMRVLPSGRTALMYPGADEVGATLVARALTRRHRHAPRLRVLSADEAGLERTPPYENQPMSASLARQMAIVGAQQVAEDADAVLVLHAPDPDRHDMFGGPPQPGDPTAAEATGRLVAAQLEAGVRVALADVRHPNGADPFLGAWLVDHGYLLGLEAYSAWNTAGNALGSALALVAAGVVGRASGSFDEAAHRQALVRRLLDDYAYQADVRWRRSEDLFGGDIRPLGADQAGEAASAIADDLRSHLDAWGVNDVELTGLDLPWNRSFEVDVELAVRPLR